MFVFIRFLLILFYDRHNRGEGGEDACTAMTNSKDFVVFVIISYSAVGQAYSVLKVKLFY